MHYIHITNYVTRYCLNSREYTTMTEIVIEVDDHKSTYKRHKIIWHLNGCLFVVCWL